MANDNIELKNNFENYADYIYLRLDKEIVGTDKEKLIFIKKRLQEMRCISEEIEKLFK